LLEDFRTGDAWGPADIDFLSKNLADRIDLVGLVENTELNADMCKVTKAERSRLIPRKLAINLEILMV